MCVASITWVNLHRFGWIVPQNAANLVNRISGFGDITKEFLSGQTQVAERSFDKIEMWKTNRNAHWSYCLWKGVHSKEPSLKTWISLTSILFFVFFFCLYSIKTTLRGWSSKLYPSLMKPPLSSSSAIFTSSIRHFEILSRFEAWQRQMSLWTFKHLGISKFLSRVRNLTM